MTPEEKTALKLDIGKIPEVLLDNTDRNRTSPFAFTGNRFEFRAVGGSANCSPAMLAVNAALANQLVKFKVEVDALIDSGVKKDEAILKVLRRLITYSKPIRFDGDGYSQAWVEEAAKRGLSNVNSTPESLKAYISEHVIDMFGELGIMTERELHSRFEVRNEIYKNKLQIEGRVIGDLAINHIIPTAIKYQSRLIENVKGLKDILPAEFQKLAANEINTIREIAEHTEAIREKVEKMRVERSKANDLASAPEQATAYFGKVKPYFEDIRHHIDALELIVDDELWPLPKYRELLFTR
jgi:glutamine synthetase